MHVSRFLPLLGLLVLCGCHVNTHKDGNNNDVSIGTPFGSMQVKTDKSAAAAGLGLTTYPGATVVHKKDDNDGAADVHMSFGSFHLGVDALELQSSDPQSKVLAFYRKDMGHFGAVLTCHGSETVGEPTRTADGLTCNTDNHGSHDTDLELRAGSPQHQHIVSVKDRDGGTHIGLVAVDLPGGSRQDAESRE